jgi:hypothetical protein
MAMKGSAISFKNKFGFVNKLSPRIIFYKAMVKLISVLVQSWSLTDYRLSENYALLYYSTKGFKYY